MRAFLASLAVAVILAAGAAWVFESWISVTVTEAYSRDTARVGHDEAVEGRPGFAPDAADD